MVYSPDNGPPARFVADIIGKWAFGETAGLLIILGESPQGLWAIEATLTDGRGSLDISLTLADTTGARKSHELIRDEEPSEYYSPDTASSIVLGRLWRLNRLGRWDADSMVSVIHQPLNLAPSDPTCVAKIHGKEGIEYYWRFSIFPIMCWNNYVWSVITRGPPGEQVMVDLASLD